MLRIVLSARRGRRILQALLSVARAEESAPADGASCDDTFPNALPFGQSVPFSKGLPLQRIPEPLKKIVDQAARLPGLGPKSAMRVAMTLLKWPEAETRRLGKGIFELRDKLHLCSRCGGFSDTDPCPVCSDQERDASSLCLVSEWDSMLTLEEGAFYRGQYMILGGLLAPLDNRPAESLEMDRLLSRLAEGEISELVLALGATAEAEATSSFIRNSVSARFPHIRITRLAQGIPLGGEVKYMDRETLRQSMQYRQEIQPAAR